MVDAMTGQDAVNVAKTFNETLEISGVVLTKLDGGMLEVVQHYLLEL